MRQRHRIWSASFFGLTVLLLAATGRGQITAGGGTLISNPSGVYIDAEGVVHQRQADSSEELAKMRKQARDSAATAKDPKLCYVSLPKLFLEVRELMAANKPIPDSLKYLGGMTQIRYVLLYPEEKDLIIAGPAEPVDAGVAVEPVGKRSGRPVMHLDDLVVALRDSAAPRGTPFGCSIDLPPDSLKKFGEVLQNSANVSRKELKEQAVRAIGPQSVRVFGTSADTRTAFVCVAADYKMKRLSMALDRCPVADVGNSVDNSDLASNRFWFEMMYEPILVSHEANAYEFRGQRLQLKAGAQEFDPKGATAAGIAFAKRFTQNVPGLASAMPIFADLQNLADLSLLASLIREDRLDRKAGWDFGWVMDVKGYPVGSVPVARTADTLVNITGQSMVAGGVMLNPAVLLPENARQNDDNRTLPAVKEQRGNLLAQQPTTGPILMTP